MEREQRLAELEAKIVQLTNTRKRHAWRSRWAAVGAAIAVSLGGGTALHFAMAAPGDVVTNSFVPISPTRILDTRPLPLNVGGFVGPLTSAQTHNFQVSGVAGVPANATAVVMNVTVDATTGSSFLTVFPTGTIRPLASNLNWVAGDVIPNLVTVKLGAGGQISVYNLNGATHVIADVAGYYVPGNDKFISLDVFGTPLDTATFAIGVGSNSGLVFRDGMSDSVSFHFVLPPDYTPGTAIVGTFTWHTASTSCGVAFRPNYVSVSRAGVVHIEGPGVSAGMTLPGPSVSNPTTNVVQSSTFTLNSPVPATPLQPGDSYTFGLFRAGDDAVDSCGTPALIDSMVIRYE